MKRYFTFLKTELKLSVRDMNMPIFAVIMPLVIFIILGIISPKLISIELKRIPIIMTIYPGRFVRSILRLNLVLNGIFVLSLNAFLLLFFLRSLLRNFRGLSFSFDVRTARLIISISMIGTTVERINADASQTV